MVCCCCKDDEKHPQAYMIIKEHRFKEAGCCTDIVFLAAFVLSWLISGFVVNLAIEDDADIDRITHGVDFSGNICGVSEGYEDRPLAAWPYPLYYDYLICVADCGELDDMTDFGLPANEHLVVPYPTRELVGFCFPDLTELTALADGFEFNSSSSTDSAALESFGDFGDLGGWAAAITQAFADLYAGKDIILICFVIAFVFAFISMFFVSRCVKPLIYSLILAILIGLLILGYFLFDYAENWDTNGITEADAEYVQITAYVIWGIDFICLCVFLFLRKALATALSVIAMSSDAFMEMKTLVFVPVWGTMMLLVYMIYWLYGAALIYSVGTYSSTNTSTELKYYYLVEDDFFRNGNSDTYMTFTFSEDMQYPAAYHFFHMLWVNQFILYFSYLVFAGATADWYFTRLDEDNNRKRGSKDDEFSTFPVAAACKRTFIHHMGTVAFASFLIAVIQFIRAVVHYIESKSKGMKNPLQKCLFKCIKCCLWCAECCMDKLNKNALIYTAIFGTKLTTSACASFRLLFANLDKVIAINVVTSFVIGIAKLFNGTITCLVGILLLQNVSPYNEKVASPTMCAIVIFIIGYAVGSSVLSVYNAVIDSVFICYLIDEDKNKDKDGGMFAGQEFQAKIIEGTKGSGKKVAPKKVAPEIEMTETEKEGDKAPKDKD
jgi:hypothetical protein